MIDLKNLTIEKAYQGMLHGEFTSRELTEAYLGIINNKNTDFSHERTFHSTQCDSLHHS